MFTAKEDYLAAKVAAAVTAGLRPDLFAKRGVVSGNRRLLVIALALLALAGFGFRLTNLSGEGLSEDELNKWEAVKDYRQHGLTAANSEHPLLMKALQTATVVFADKWNSTSLGDRYPIASETALRFPSVLFGALTAILIYLLATELFGAEVGLIAAALWTFDPSAIGFNRIAKEDTFLLFFFLLANVFWLCGQRVAESKAHCCVLLAVSVHSRNTLAAGQETDAGVLLDHGCYVSAAQPNHPPAGDVATDGSVRGTKVNRS